METYLERAHAILAAEAAAIMTVELSATFDAAIDPTKQIVLPR